MTAGPSCNRSYVLGSCIPLYDILIPFRMSFCYPNLAQIPGITVPFSHTLPLLFALFVSQVVHELGHLAVASLYVSLTVHCNRAAYLVRIPSRS